MFTTTHVLRGGAPITHVHRDEDDHGLQFHYPGEKSISDCMIVALEEIVRHDPTVLEVADLPPGYVAIRKGFGFQWRVERSLIDGPQSDPDTL